MPNNNEGTKISSLSLKEATKLLIKHYGFHEGKYNISVDFKIGVGSTSDNGEIIPTAMIGFSKIGLVRNDDNPNEMSVDAAIVNPVKSS